MANYSFTTLTNYLTNSQTENKKFQNDMNNAKNSQPYTSLINSNDVNNYSETNDDRSYSLYTNVSQSSDILRSFGRITSSYSGSRNDSVNKDGTITVYNPLTKKYETYKGNTEYDLIGIRGAIIANELAYENSENQDIKNYAKIYLADNQLISSSNQPKNISSSTNTFTSYQRAWDPRLARLDMFFLKNTNGTNAVPYLIPFASNTASSAFYDFVFTADSKKINEIEKYHNNGNSKSSTTGTKSAAVNEKTNPNTGTETLNSKSSTGDKSAINNNITKTFQNDQRFYGVASLINPYSITKLLGSLEGSNDNFKTVNGETYMFPSNNRFYDIRDQRRFYDITKMDSDGTLIHDDGTSNPLDINNPTTTNIITWSNQDLWGRTPYSFQDFVFCKNWNIIPNNRLLTLRKYPYPTLDNLNFSGMATDTISSKKIPFSPIATAVSYFGENTNNKLSDLLKISTGVKWGDVNASIWNVTGEQGNEGNLAADKTLGDFGANQGYLSSIFKSNKAMQGILDDMQTGMQTVNNYGKFLGILGGGTYGTEQETWNQLNSAQQDPYNNGPYANRVQGPINRIDTVKKRDPGITFENTMSVKCEYISRPIGGINTKAAMLDIISNALVIGSENAVFWGGGYKFTTTAKVNPWTYSKLDNGMLGALYKGKVFGEGGGIDQALKGIKSFGTNKTGSFSWETMLGSIGNIFGSMLGALGGVMSSILSPLFGDTGIESLTDKGINLVSGDPAKAKKGANSILGSVNSLWKNKVIQNTVYPQVNGMRSILIGEPVGNWHLTIGNPLNPIAVIGNLICDKVNITFGEELGPDDFPLEVTIEYSLQHGMARDRAGIESMFNRGAGKIYELPDYMQATSDMETRVDSVTGGTAFRIPSFAAPGETYGNTTWKKAYNITKGKTASNSGNSETTILTSFTPVNQEAVSGTLSGFYNFLENNTRSIATYYSHNAARKTMK